MIYSAIGLFVSQAAFNLIAQMVRLVILDVASSTGLMVHGLVGLLQACAGCVIILVMW